MASFWKTSEGTFATGEVPENDFKPIPKGWYKSIIEEMVIKVSAQFGDKISVKARIHGPSHVNRVIFCNLKVYDENPKARDRALNVLVAIAGAVNVALPKGDPDDAWLAKLTNRPLEMLFDVWEMENKDGETIDGNWLVNARGSSQAHIAKSQSKHAEVTEVLDADDDIPF